MKKNKPLEKEIIPTQNSSFNIKNSNSNKLKNITTAITMELPNLSALMVYDLDSPIIANNSLMI